ncbi:hypothetical protein BH20CHL6_BH20CHL6_15470 [soil metagenome]
MAPLRLRLQQGGIGARDQFVACLALPESGEPDADADRLPFEQPFDCVETATDVIDVGPAEPANELVTAVADDGIEGAEARSDGSHHGAQDAVTRADARHDR